MKTPTKIDILFRKLRADLIDIMDIYEVKAEKNPFKLRATISSDDIWRFFIDGRLQASGRKLQEALLFKRLKNTSIYFRFFNGSPLNLTIAEYMKQFEKIDYDNEDEKRKSELWCVLMRYKWYLSDIECTKFKLIDLIRMDKAWLPFERNESGYLEALYTAFDKIFKYAPATQITLDFIKNLHALSTKGVKGTNYDMARDKQGEMRETKSISFTLTPANCTKAGLMELFNKMLNDDLYKNNLNIFIRTDNSKNIGFMINHAFIKEIFDYKSSGESNIDINIFLKYCLANTAHLQKQVLKTISIILNKIVNADADSFINETTKCLYEILSEQQAGENLTVHLASIQASKNTSEVLEEEMKKLLFRYHQHMSSASDPMQKLEIIISLVQACEQLHPFSDANCRTFCMLLLNHLLIRNNFPIVILENPNNFDLYSSVELLETLIDGMQNTFTLIATGELFNVKTSQILDFLESEEYLSNIRDYFYNVVKIEDLGRSNLMEPDRPAHTRST